MFSTASSLTTHYMLTILLVFVFSAVEEDEGEVDESGVEESDIKLVMDQAQVWFFPSAFPIIP